MHQICNAVFMAVMTPRLFVRLNLQDPENQKIYIHSLVDKLL
jgi:hypothetical protein